MSLFMPTRYQTPLLHTKPSGLNITSFVSFVFSYTNFSTLEFQIEF